jgi:hypothetical protein
MKGKSDSGTAGEAGEERLIVPENRRFSKETVLRDKKGGAFPLGDII